MVDFQNHNTDVYLYENLNEGLIKSYTINTVLDELVKLHPNLVSNIERLDKNPYFSKGGKIHSQDDFAKIILKTSIASFLSYEKVINTCYRLFGWFTGIVIVYIKQNKGLYKPISFFRGDPYKRKEHKNPKDCFFSETEEDELNQYIRKNLNSIVKIELIIEEKYPIKQYLYSSDDIFYHKTSIEHKDKILKNGLVPKSKFNYSSRIYLARDLSEYDQIELKNDDNAILFRVNLKNGQNIFYDPRSNGVFTYDNISPSEIVLFK